MILLFVFAALLLTGFVLRVFTKHRHAGRILLQICGCLAAFVGMLVAFLLFAWYSSSSAALTRPQINLLLTAVPGLALVLALIFRNLRRKVLLIPAFAVLAAGLALTGHTLYTESIPVVSTSSCLTYNPYDEKYAAYMPDKACTLSLSGELPRLDGATALYPVYASFFRAAYPEGCDWTDLIDCSTTSYAYENIVSGKTDIIFVADASKAQKEAAAQKGVELKFTPLGYEAFVFIVNSRNPLDNITPEQICDIYSGRVTRWSELGVKGLGGILPYQRSEGSGSQTAFEKWFIDGENLLPAITGLKADTMGGMYETVADYKNYKNAIGYSFRYYCTEMLGGKGIKLLSVNSVAPTVENIENGSYPYTGKFYAVTRSDADENTCAFLEWMTGPQGQEIIRKVGYSPIAAEGRS